MARVIICLFFCCLTACSTEEAEITDNSVIFKTSDRLISRASDSFEIPWRLDGLQADFAYDEINGVFWLHTVKNAISEFRLLKEDGSIAETFPVAYDDVIPSVGGGFFVNDNMAIISAWGEADKTCIIANLSDLTYKKCYIGHLKFKVIMGFSGETIYGNGWSYNFETGVLVNFPGNIRYCRYVPGIDKLIGLTPEGMVVLYDYVTNKVEPTGVTRKIRNKFTYRPEELYFFDNDYLYYSVYDADVPPALYFTFFLDAPEPRKWHRFDMETGKREIIKSPSRFSKIIGRKR
jgi:hypothetical protein